VQIGFIGLGNMGGPMATNLVNAGHDVAVYDINPAVIKPVVFRGGRGAGSPSEAASGADVVMTSLPGPMQVRAIAETIVPAMRPGAVWAELSTNDLSCARDIGRQTRDAGVLIVDAPVSGGWEGAQAGTLTILVGGTDQAFAAAMPALDVIGTKIEHLGPHGAGYVAKISQVMLCYLHSVCLTEALMLGVKGGVDPAKMLDIIQCSTGGSYVADRYGPEILNGGYDDNFDLGLAAKDLRLGMNLAASVDAHLPFTDQVTKLYGEAEEQFGFSAPHLIAMQMIENANDLILHQQQGST
jgi:3-hydroxyisobutyrate dehydrogenase-like beta-hydroxyacid dehydrogenase